VRRPASRPSARPDADELTVAIARLGAQGDGIARLGAQGDGISALPDGGTLYVPFALPGETVRVRARRGNRATAFDILTASPARIEPECPHFGACGGCALQHFRAAEALAWKVERLRDALARAGYPDAPLAEPVAVGSGTRRRADFALRRVDGAVRLGFHAAGEPALIVPLETCTVVAPPIAALIPKLRTLVARLRCLRRDGSAVVTLLAAGPDLLLRTDGTPDAADRDAMIRFAVDSNLTRLHAATGRAAPEPICLLRPATIRFAGTEVTPPPGGFLQPTEAGEAAIVAAVLAGLPARAGRIVEFHAGCGTLTLPLSQRGHVTAFEGDADAVAALRRAAGGHVALAQRDLARQPPEPRAIAKFDVAVLDPPYAGAPDLCAAIAASGVKRVIYVSCNPAALARDAASLHAAGYRLERATPIDQFTYAPHLEAVAAFAR
jgi:23S rRNA (uracil1939-C5)-methyltransferase